MPRLENKVALVLGGARGIGAETVRQFLAEGATVYTADIRPSEVSPHERLEVVQLDATDEVAVRTLVEQIVAEHDHIDVLFCNVGVHLGASIEETTLEGAERVWKINVVTVILACKYVIPVMRQHRAGSIIVTSSNGGVMGRPSDPVYNATKHGLVGLVKSLAVAYAHEGLRANAISPGAIDTDMMRESVPSLELEMEKRAAASTPAARIADPREVAMAVVFLASDESRFTNGVVIPVDGAKAAGALQADRYSLDFELQGRRWADAQ